MKNSLMTNYGFNYTHDGKSYAFHVAATSIHEAEARVRSMSAATAFGELQEVVSGPAIEITEESSSNTDIPARPGRSPAASLAQVTQHPA